MPSHVQHEQVWPYGVVTYATLKSGGSNDGPSTPLALATACYRPQ